MPRGVTGVEDLKSQILGAVNASALSSEEAASVLYTVTLLLMD